MAVGPGLALDGRRDDSGSRRHHPRQAADLHAVEDQPASARVEAVAHLLGIPRLSGRTAAELKKHVGLPPRLVATALVCPENLVI